MVIAIFVDRAYHQYTQGWNFPIRTTPKTISISELWVIFQGSPCFLAISACVTLLLLSTLNSLPSSTKLGGTVGVTKKNDLQWLWTWSRPEWRKNGRFYVWPKSVFWPNVRFFPKTPKICWIAWYFMEEGTFLFAQLFLVVARTWLELRSVCFFWAWISVFDPWSTPKMIPPTAPDWFESISGVLFPFRGL